MKFRTILTFAFSIALAYAQMSDTEAEGLSGEQGALDQVPDLTDAANVSGQGVEAGLTEDNGEASDDYGNAAAVDAMDAGEISDNNESNESSAVNPAENPVAAENLSAITIPTAQQATSEQNTPFTGASGEAAPVAAAEAAAEKEKPTVALDDKTKTETSIDPAKIASGLVGAAAISSAGVFFMVKRAKRRGLESVRSQISMA
ncbi:hypothetical protein BCR32DRAFT_328080 [Anaeromyces robustus]|jgi:cell wall-associated NlpC family hydrolase|uniref:Mid2 domain-containing protein n=1 Tax=Anaeromyces robustus TaxID=1754192 RepID=A0A1Y1X1R9_9FUNG|nr:hypothetical protein BCR32DRAFT_328080 [Anaeromyces robustus]|eukprot:ORX79568.1 hypothetical protein BCR32DRAFT_328080 [Anaeromyces robustus]